MFSPHLAKGAAQPAKVDGKLRLYSMQFCPFAERVRIVLLAKGIPHDIVNINLFDKPEWLFKLNPRALVPILDTGSEIICESATICDYLDKEYPNPPLYSQNEGKNQIDRDLVEDYGTTLIPLYYAAAWKKKENKDLKDYLEDMLPHLKKLEAELAERGTFFGGSDPQMIDYMIWPWAERVGVLEIIHNQKIPVTEEILPNIFKWCGAMKNLEPIKETITSTERLYKVTLFHHPGAVIDYDGI